jgi:ribosomal protein S18 acetylase RimI-like enzyme
VPKPRVVIVPLGPDHGRAGFSCGEPALDFYLQRQASQDMRRRVAQVFVAASEDQFLIDGYYTLSATSIDKTGLSPELAKKLPHYPIPSVLLGRLAVASTAQGRGLGELLLLDALRRSLRASIAVAMYAVIVDAKNQSAEAFYKKYGFQNLATDQRRLFLQMATVEKLGL